MIQYDERLLKNIDEEHGFMKIAEKGEYEKAYEDYLVYRGSWISYSEFMLDFNKGYGKTASEISKYIETENGIFVCFHD